MTKAERSRLTAWRLRVLKQAADDGNVARACRRFGLSRKSFYKWKRRRAEHRDIGLCDRARTPQRSPGRRARCDRDLVEARQVPHDAAGSEVVMLSQVEVLLTTRIGLSITSCANASAGRPNRTAAITAKIFFMRPPIAVNEP